MTTIHNLSQDGILGYYDVAIIWMLYSLSDDDYRDEGKDQWVSRLAHNKHEVWIHYIPMHVICGFTMIEY